MGNNNSDMKPYKKYKRPQFTVQDTLTDREINAMLEDYIEIDVDKLPTLGIGTHIRYFTVEYENNRAKKVFRIGGNLVNVDKQLRYIVLRQNSESWSVQTENTIFYRQLTIDEVKDEFEEIIGELEDEILELKKVNRALYEKIKNKKYKMQGGATTQDNTEKKTLMSATKSVVRVRKSETKKMKDFMTTTEKHIRL